MAAIDNINGQDLVELKALLKPADVIRLVFDCVLLLMSEPVAKTALAEVSVGSGRTKHDVEFLADSFAMGKVRMCC